MSSDVSVKKNPFVNDGDIKVIGNKFRWKYLRQDIINLLVYGIKVGLSKNKK